MIIPAEQWKPVELDLIFDASSRDPNTLLLAVTQFGVETHPRYQPLRNPATGALRQTWCNVYLWDVTRALDCEIPHWIDHDGEPCEMGQGTETTANAVCDWLQTLGPQFGWVLTDHAGAVDYANQGMPAVVVWKNPTGASGHVAVVLPSPNPGVILSAQAGATNFVGKPYQNGFGDREVTFYRHQ
jgi:hypothetical protein